MADEKRKSIPVGLGQEIGQFDSSDLKKTEVNEKNPLPSSEVICQEKTIKNIEEFDPKNLKHAETTEKHCLPSSDVVAQEKTIESIEGFDKGQLKHADTTVKDSLPSNDAIAQEKTIQNIEAFDKGQLRPTTTEEKNTLPDKATIDQEKTTKWAALCVTNLSPTMPWWSQSALLRSATPCNRVAIYTVVSLLYVDFSACASIGRQLLVFY